MLIQSWSSMVAELVLASALTMSATSPVAAPGRYPRTVVLNDAALSPRNITMEAKVSWSGTDKLQQRIVEKSSHGFGNQSARNGPVVGLIDEAALFDEALAGNQTLVHFRAQVQDSARFQYAVKFVCGKSDRGIVAPGEYFTAINVHNPNKGDIGFKKKFAVALPGERPGRVSRMFDARLGPDQAFEIDCPDILRRTNTREGFLKGFVVIESALELDVVAVYTAAGATGQVETMELERVKPRRQGAEGKSDLIPVPDPNPRIGFCRRRDSELTVTVQNQGTAGAGPSITTVDFAASGTVSQQTRSLGAGASIDLVFTIPAGCFRPDCHFRITADSSDQVDESNESNNTASGVCQG
jgi:hypothetical protein